VKTFSEEIEMKTASSIAAAVLLSAAMTACERDTKTTVAPTPALPQSSAQSGSSTTTGVASTSLDYSKSMERLQTAAQRLREAIQSMAQEPAGPRRNEAIKQAQQALYDTNQAMIQLPPDMRIESSSSVGTTSSAGASGTVGSVVYPTSDAEYSKAMEKLQQSAQKLREAVQAMAQEQGTDRRNQAIKEAHQALYDTNQAMIQLPPEMRTEK
jgi:hypothetical protein